MNLHRYHVNIIVLCVHTLCHRWDIHSQIVALNGFSGSETASEIYLRAVFAVILTNHVNVFCYG